MSDAQRMLVWMGLFVAAVAAVAALLYVPLAAAFMANPVFNGLILGVLALGVAVNFAHAAALLPAGRWVEEAAHGPRAGEPPRLVAPLAKVLGGREALSMSTLAMRSLLDGVRMRLDESRDIARYMVGLLIFLGLLGTFWGLLDTIGGVGAVIGALSPEAADPARTLAGLQADLQGPLAGMGTAFSSSLFGLAGALALGVLDLQAGHAQNRFFAGLEEALSAHVRLGAKTLGVEGVETPLPAYIEALLQQTAENLSELQRMMARGEEERRASQQGLAALTDRLAELTDQLRAEQKLIVTLSRNQAELRPAMAELATQVTGALAGNEEMRAHLRNVDRAAARLLEEVAAARSQLPEAMRQELRVLAQSLGAAQRERV